MFINTQTNNLRSGKVSLSINEFEKRIMKAVIIKTIIYINYKKNINHISQGIFHNLI